LENRYQWIHSLASHGSEKQCSLHTCKRAPTAYVETSSTTPPLFLSLSHLHHFLTSVCFGYFKSKTKQKHSTCTPSNPCLNSALGNEKY
jgi:hypothetical protein